MNPTVTFEEIQKIAFEDIRTIYLGRADRCYCGCAGTYRYTTFQPPDYSWQGKVNDSAVRQRKTRMLRIAAAGAKIQKLPALGAMGETLYTIEFGNHMALTMYVKKFPRCPAMTLGGGKA
jgi:hypothetical protein